MVDVDEMDYPLNGDTSGLGRYSAVRLFLERARQADARFNLTEEDQPQIGKICRLVRGTPLGIELAAAWVPVLSCREIASEIEANLDFLEASGRQLPDKHRSLRAAFEHSWKLLSAEQRQGLACLSVFRGGFDRHSAREIAGAELRLLADLVSKSLVRRKDHERYEIHELIRQFAAEALDESRQEATIQEKHSHYYRRFISERLVPLKGDAHIVTRAEFRTDLANIERALDWAITHWDSSATRDFIKDLYDFYQAQSWFQGGEALGRIADSIAAQPDFDATTDIAYWTARMRQAHLIAGLGAAEQVEAIGRELTPIADAMDPVKRAYLGLGLGIIADYQGDYISAEKHLVNSAAFAELSGDHFVLGMVLLWLGWVKQEVGRYAEARADYLKAHDIWKGTGHLWALPFSLSKIGVIADSMGDVPRAKQYQEAARDLFVRFEDKAGEAYATSRMSATCYFMKNYPEAMRFGEEALALFTEINHTWGRSVCPCRIGFAQLEMGQVDEAEARFFEGLRVARETSMRQSMLYALIGIGGVRGLRGQDESGRDAPRARDRPAVHAGHVPGAGVQGACRNRTAPGP